MHPQLDRNRFDKCEKLMEALEQCHNQVFLKQLMGLCNFEKDELSKCLHVTRMEQSKAHIKATRDKQKAIQKTLRKEEEEVYGKNNYLKKVVELETQKRQGRQ
ncbi:UPF0287-domain-containing protein [Metschnikowia bicuspidata]|uniref:COX assembly mitochondrial protein n=1 Tax=Metschnikowia bicuspidata TaxID=27322 RepID=A0A4V1J3N5_9ASCO|nr:UPF0287-domain-containing protein [Metschnikowia bicuspidata]